MYDIQLQNITLIKNGRKLLDDVEIHFPKGKTTVIIGPSGCGKSTLLKVTAGLIPIDSGEIIINNLNLAKMNSSELMHFRKESSFVFQDAALWSNQSVFQNISLPLSVHFPELDDKTQTKRINEILELVGYTASIHLRPAQLSNGERKMVSLARALIISPSLLYMDNPLVLVDPSVAKKMERLIDDLHKSETTIIANFSSVKLINSIADYLVIMKDGKLVETGTMESIRNSSIPDTRFILNSLLNHPIGTDSV
ncbi:MAG: ATP-binding cassette domain-containing protein [Spirochaetales bacterium]|nr:ATP-binding cassette domain-containing protein [Spirochaetales bacterium]